MPRTRLLLPLIVGLLLSAPASTAWGSTGATKFRPRIGGALGLVPRAGSLDVASGVLTPVVYHGGSVMAGRVTIHTIFWAPSGFQFQGAPPGSIGYEDLLKQFFTDAAHDSGTAGNVFSVLPQFAQGTRVGAVTPGSYSISYDPAINSVDDTQPYPGPADQCASPSNVTTCVTDAQVQAEVDRVVQATSGTPRGLNNIWYVFLPPNVDECILPGACGTNAFGGYHSLTNINGHGVTIYAITPDPLIATTVPPGSDPQGNPDAEMAVDVAGHETEEAMTDPQGVGWMDPNGFESADKCEIGPQHGTPLGYAPNGSPYNQLINGHPYLLQGMWSNNDHGCVQSTSLTGNPLPLPQVNMTQFSSTVSGSIERNVSGVGVALRLRRAAADGSTVTVAAGSTTTAADGSWSLSLGHHALGDDRDQVTVDYSGAGAPTPSHQVIQTGNGGNPFTQSGWTGWFDLDNGSLVTNNAKLGGPSVTLGPCFQTGVLGVTINGSPLGPSPTDFCNTQTDTATVATPTIAPTAALTASSNDNRAFSPPDGPSFNPDGALVKLSVPVGEPDAVSLFLSPLGTFQPSGFPSCTADLEAQAVTCTGLVAGRHYALTDGNVEVSQVADATGTLTGQFPVGRLRGGDSVSLSHGSRTWTTLHVAHLKVSIAGSQTVLSGGTCEPGAYYGAPLSQAPTNPQAGGPGVALSGQICPLNGQPMGFSTSTIAQTDERSAGQTQTEVPDIENTSPIQGETVYGAFTALAESGLPGPDNSIIPTDQTSRIALSIAPAARRSPVFRAGNVDTANGVSVKGLRSGAYTATWTLRDANGDTRTVKTRFIEHAGASSHRGHVAKPKVTCNPRFNDNVTCSATFPNPRARGTVRMTVIRGGKVVAMGHGRVNHGEARITTHELRHVTSGLVNVTLVLTQPPAPPTTSTLGVRL